MCLDFWFILHHIFRYKRDITHTAGLGIYLHLHMDLQFCPSTVMNGCVGPILLICNLDFLNQ